MSFYSSLFKALWTLVFARLYTPQEISTRDLSGQIAIITGANSGIGLSIATQLARNGATVYLACRNSQRGAKAVDEISSKIGGKFQGKVHCWELDTSDLKNVRNFCARWAHEGKKIDMLVHNAGIAAPPPESPKTTGDGKDLVLVTNFLGSFLMTHLLEPYLSITARVVLTSSSGHYAASQILKPHRTTQEHCLEQIGSHNIRSGLRTLKSPTGSLREHSATPLLVVKSRKQTVSTQLHAWFYVLSYL
jgi:NADP-dependent 3-hydroxy acid dehydrogenase YdfG